MADLSPKPRRGLAIPRIAYQLGAAWALVASLFAAERWVTALDLFIRNDLLVRWFGKLTAYEHALSVYQDMVGIPAMTFLVTLFFSQGIFASCRILPRPVYAVAAFYIVAGTAVLFVCRDDQALSPGSIGSGAKSCGSTCGAGTASGEGVQAGTPRASRQQRKPTK